jgi:hypothetical protein
MNKNISTTTTKEEEEENISCLSTNLSLFRFSLKEKRFNFIIILNS